MRKLFFLLTAAILLACTACSGSFIDPGMDDSAGGRGGLGDWGDGWGDIGGGGGGGSKLATPKGVKAEAVDSSSIYISWNDVDEALRYFIYRSTKSSGPYEKITYVLYFFTYYTDTGLDANTTYYYKVTAGSLSGDESAQSSSVSAKTKKE